MTTPALAHYTAQARIAELEAEVARLKVDSERLDWLVAQDNCVVNEGTNGFWLCWIDEHDPDRTDYQKGSFQTARAAIDSAKAASKEKP